MVIEQPAVLNKHVDPSIPLNWDVRWRALKPVSPLLLISTVLLAENVAFKLWLRDENLGAHWPLLLAALLVPIVMIVILFEVQTRWTHRSRRTLKLAPKYVGIAPAKHARVIWDRIRRWRFEPLPGETELCKLTVEYTLDPKGKMPREWAMVLRRADQEQTLLSELEHYRQLGSQQATVVHLAEPSARDSTRLNFRAMTAVALGFYLLVHGVPFLGVGISGPNRAHDAASQESSIDAPGKVKLGRFVASHFSSIAEYRAFLLATGGGLTVIGLGCYFWGLRSMKAGTTPANGPRHDSSGWAPGISPKR